MRAFEFLKLIVALILTGPSEAATGEGGKLLITDYRGIL